MTFKFAVLYSNIYTKKIRFIASSQTVLNTEIFLLGKLQLVAKGQEDAFTLHV